MEKQARSASYLPMSGYESVKSGLCAQTDGGPWTARFDPGQSIDVFAIVDAGPGGLRQEEAKIGEVCGFDFDPVGGLLQSAYFVSSQTGTAAPFRFDNLEYDALRRCFLFTSSSNSRSGDVPAPSVATRTMTREGYLEH